MAEEFQYQWTDNPTVSGVAKCDTDVLNDCLMHLKYDKKGGSGLDDKITNCLLEVPQNIKLELNDGVLTLKAGSVVTVPNGFEADGTTPKFDYVTVESDKRLGISDSSSTSTQSGWFVFYNTDSTAWVRNSHTTSNFSGATAPTLSSNHAVWYDTANNVIKFTSNKGSTWTTQGTALPLCSCIRTSGTATSIDQTFNGMGYIGSTIWVDKGVKCLIPNGRNEDGSLNNIEFVTSKVLTYTSKTSFTGEAYICLNSSNVDRLRSTIFYHDTLANLNKSTNGTKVDYCFCGLVSLSNDVITSFQPKQPFRAVDYNDKAEIVSWCMPDYTAGVAKSSGTQYTAEVDGWLEIRTDDYNNRSYLTLNGIQKCVSGASNNHLANIYCMIPIPKNTIFKVVFSRTSTDNLCNFYPCKGGK